MHKLFDVCCRRSSLHGNISILFLEIIGFLISNLKCVSQLSVGSFHLDFPAFSRLNAPPIHGTWKIRRLFFLRQSPHKVCQLPVLCLLFHCNRSQQNRIGFVGHVCTHTHTHNEFGLARGVKNEKE